MYNAHLGRFSYKRRSQTHFPDEMYAFQFKALTIPHLYFSTGPGMCAVWRNGDAQYPVQSFVGLESI